LESGVVEARVGEQTIVGEPAAEDESSAIPATGIPAVLGSEVPVVMTDGSIPAVALAGGEGPAKPRLLLVEDDWRTHSALRKILGKLGWEVHSAMTVSGGLALLELKPDAIILDLMLPDGDGMAVLLKVRSEQLPMKVAVTTGVEDRKRLDEIRKLAPDALLRKPLELRDLLRVLGIEPAA
jgi:CheY-like chemotaxis protein